jgi:uncharacterized protein involved in type VI secretion and phage assembly
VGIVTNNKDPDELGRVRVKFPSLSDDDESAWARLVSPMAGADRGLFYVPEIDDEVLVGFDHGDIHRPFIIGSVWNGKDATPIKASEAVGGDGKVNKRVLKSRSGHTVTLDDTDGGEEITIVDKTGNNKIVFHSPDNSMQISIQGDLTIESTQGKITIKAATGIDVSTQQEIKISAETGAEMSTPQQLKLSGDAGAEMSTSAQLKLSGDAGTEVSTTAQLDLKGTMVNVQGSGPVAVKGAIIQLN